MRHSIEAGVSSLENEKSSIERYTPGNLFHQTHGFDALSGQIMLRPVSEV